MEFLLLWLGITSEMQVEWLLVHSMFIVFAAGIYIGFFFLKLMIFIFSIAVYKALYKSFGGFAADVVAAIDQVIFHH
jgi:hypothetical protein